MTTSCSETTGTSSLTGGPGNGSGENGSGGSGPGPMGGGDSGASSPGNPSAGDASDPGSGQNGGGGNDGGSGSNDSGVGTDSSTSSGGDVVIVGAGDIAGTGAGKMATATLVKGIPGTVFTLGDNAYQDGTDAEFTSNFGTSWGQFKSRILLPTPGNHDYHTTNAAGYFNYFGAVAGDPTKGYQSTDVGAWHVVLINSNCSSIGGCNAGSPQETWLRADLAAHKNTCTIAMWHHPLFNIGKHGPSTEMKPIWQALYDAGADVVLTGHDHDYQRWAPQDANGTSDAAKGIREFVVGTGGVGLYSFVTTNANVEAKDNQTYGVLKMTLKATSYTWEFVHESGKTFTDTGSANCH